jgi:FkbM family methyltransferase
VSSVGTWARLLRAGLHPVSALRLRRGRHDDIRFRGRPIAGADRARLAWMAVHIWGGEYDVPGFVPGRGDRVADLGANIGVFSVLAASRGARVTAVEPSAETFAWLERNAAPFGVECRRAAVVGRLPASGAVELARDARGDTANHLAGLRPDDASAPGEEVPALAFSALLAEGYDLVKLDVEGAEFDLIAGTPLEALAGLRRLVAEVHRSAGEPAELDARLTAAGMTVAIREDPADPDHVLMTARR